MPSVDRGLMTFLQLIKTSLFVQECYDQLLILTYLYQSEDF